MTETTINDWPRSVCACPKCQKACTRAPGWMTVQDAEAAMDAGYADRLCVDYWYEFDLDQYVSIIRPDGRRFFPGERCTFLTSKWQCELHDTAFKPLECRAALLCADTTQGPGRERIARDWNNDAGRAAVARLESLTEVKESVA